MNASLMKFSDLLVNVYWSILMTDSIAMDAIDKMYNEGRILDIIG